jgi:hypothetical protein
MSNRAISSGELYAKLQGVIDLPSNATKLVLTLSADELPQLEVTRYVSVGSHETSNQKLEMSTKRYRIIELGSEDETGTDGSEDTRF